MITSLFKGFTLLGAEWVMWVLVLLSIASLAIIIERVRALRSQEKLGKTLWEKYLGKWVGQSSKSFDVQKQAKEIKGTFPCVEGELVTLLAEQKGAAKSDQELVMASFLERKKLDLEKSVSFLGTVGSNAPFIGLFGTVLGIIKAFHDLGGSIETAGAQTISSGLSEALVATAIGLMVAIPAVVAFNYFQRKIRKIVGRAESLGNFLIASN